MIFYFTGTGNSLYVAKQLEEHPVSIPQIIRRPDLDFSADRIGIVAPVYGHEVPPMVKDFLKKASGFLQELWYDDKQDFYGMHPAAPGAERKWMA